jgi:HlyD family secretion protein
VKKLILGFGLVALTSIALAGCGGAPPATTPTPTLAPVSGLGTPGSVISDGQVVPAKSVALGMPTAGIVAEIPVKEGDHVDAGALLVRLAAGQQQAAVVQAQAALKRAQATRQKLDEPVDQNLIIAARADLDNAAAALKQAQAAYDRAGGATNPYIAMSPQSLSLEQATNDYNAAKAKLDNLMKPPSAADIASADAGIASAQADLQSAQAVLADTELHAPFAGTIATIDTKVGEAVTAGAPIVQLADFSAWQVETTDLTEINIVNVQAGDTAMLSFDAIPDLDLSGKVTNIEPFGTDHQGDIVYKVTVTPDKMDPRLRWNMTAKVTVEPKQ